MIEGRWDACRTDELNHDRGFLLPVVSSHRFEVHHQTPVKRQLKPGDTVRVVGARRTAKIRAILTSVHGALLETQIDGFRRWNLDELRLVKRKTRASR